MGMQRIMQIFLSGNSDVGERISRINNVVSLIHPSDHVFKHPKDGELYLWGMKPEETVVDVLIGTDVQIVLET